LQGTVFGVASAQYAIAEGFIYNDFFTW